MLSKSSSNPEIRIFLHYRNKQTFLIDKNVLIVMVPSLINKDVFEPNYNDLKFMVQSCNYVWTNLIGRPVIEVVLPCWEARKDVHHVL